MSIDARLNEIHDELFKRARQRVVGEWLDSLRSVRGWFAAAFDRSSAMSRPSTDQDAGDAVARLLRSARGGGLADSVRVRADGVSRRTLLRAATAGYFEDQRARAAAYDAETADFVSVEFSPPDSAERQRVSELTVDGRPITVVSAVLATSLWSAAVGALGRRIVSETGGWESSVQVLRDRMSSAFDKFETDGASAAMQFYAAGVAASAREMARVFAEDVTVVE